ncbi:MAG: hypothetical protein H7Y28_15770 [Rhodoferax sp.]|nr:hypothetical protein [Rhodoferax sp.]
MTVLSLREVNANVYSVHRVRGADSVHVGNLKRVGAVWKFKAIGYDADGSVVPGGGPLTDRHNAEFATPDLVALNARLT